MKIAVLSAMKEEVNPLIEEFSRYQTLYIAKRKIYFLYLEKKVTVIIIQCGIGKVAAAIGTMLAIEKYRADIIINMGSIGSPNKILNIGDIIIPRKICYHDVDLTTFGYERGQIPNCSTTFKSDIPLTKIAVNCTSSLGMYCSQGLVVSGDRFIDSINTFFLNTKVVGVDMESAAVAHVCSDYHVPFVIIRAVSDKIGSHLSFSEFFKTAARRSASVVKILLERIS